jgi:hypothetical protein
LICDIVDDNNAVCSAIVARSDCAEALLASSVPDLELDIFAIDFDSFEAAYICEIPKIDSYGG